MLLRGPVSSVTAEALSRAPRRPRARSRSAPPEHDGYSALEKSVIEQQLSERGLSLENAPEGKLIEEIQIVTLDVFDERDPMPDFVNVLHATTQRAGDSARAPVPRRGAVPRVASRTRPRATCAAFSSSRSC